MDNEAARLRNEIAQLEQAIANLAGIPDAQKPLQDRLAEKKAALAKLAGRGAAPASSTTTTIHGNVTGPVLPGTFHGPVTIGGTTVNQGPTVSGPIQAGRDVNVAREQTITNHGDSTTAGNSIGSSGDQFNMSGDFRGAVVNIKSSLDHVSQSIGVAGHLDQVTADQLRRLVAQLGAELQQHAAQSPDGAAELARRTETVVAEATRPKPDKQDVQYGLERLKKAAANVGALIPTVLPIAGQLTDFIRKLVGL